MSAGVETPTGPRKRSVRQSVLIFFCTAITIAGCMFFYKLFQFLKTIRKDELAGFAFDPIIVYGVVAVGFLFMLGWAFLSGQFRDVERAKYDMLERFERDEASELAAVRRSR